MAERFPRPHIVEIELPTKHGEVKARFQHILGYSVFILAEEVDGLPEGSVFIRNTSLGYFMVYVDGIYSALRGLAHAKNRYGLGSADAAEQGELRQMTVSAATLRILLRRIWNYKKMGKRERAEYRDMCLAIAEDLGKVRDEGKVIAKGRIAAASDPTDSLGRENWPSRSPMIWSAADKLEDRRISIEVIAKWVDVREFALLAELDRIWYWVWRVQIEVTELARIPSNIDAKHIDGIKAQLAIITEVLPEYPVRPFRRSFRRSATDLCSAVKLLERHGSERVVRVRQYFDRVRRSMEIMRIRRSFEEIIMPLSLEMRRRKHDPQVMADFVADVVLFRDSINVDLDHDFRKRILPEVIREINGALKAAERDDWKEFKNKLVTACEPF